MTHIKVSVIVPVYNSENHLHECLESITNQTLKAIEIIVVDDGSTDNSINIIKGFAQNDMRIIVQTQTNQGQGAARNNAIEISKGEYLCFVDSDDKIDINALDTLYNISKTHNLDILEGQYDRFSTNNKHSQPSTTFEITPHPVTGITYIKNYAGAISTAVWNKLWKSSFARHNMLKNGEDFWGAEDVPFAIDGLVAANTIMNTDLVFYHYRENPSSTTNLFADKYISGRVKMLTYLNAKRDTLLRDLEEDILIDEMLRQLAFTLKAYKKWTNLGNSKNEIINLLEEYIKKYKKNIVRSKHFSLKEKMLLSHSYKLYTLFYFIKRKIGLKS